MCSIRSGCVLAMMLVALAMTAAGCQGINKHQEPAPVNNTPLVVDEAMQIRDWDRNTSYYANGATIAGGTAYCWETADGVNPDHRRFIDGPVAALNIVCMPVGLFVNSPFEKQVIHGEIIPPTYTGQPPLPGEPQVSNGAVLEPIETVPLGKGTATEGGRAGTVTEPGTPPPAPPAVETPPSTETPPLAPSETPTPTPTPPSPSDTPAPAPPPVQPPTAESAPPPAPATPEPPAPSPVPAPPTEPLNK